MLSRLLSLQQADAAFPSGSFAFSNGIEGLIAGDPAFDTESLTRTLTALVRFRWAESDRVALILAHRAGPDPVRLGRVDAAVEAATLVEAMRTGSRRNGASLLTTHARLATPGAAEIRAAIRSGLMLGHLATVQGALWRALGLSEPEAATAIAALMPSIPVWRTTPETMSAMRWISARSCAVSAASGRMIGFGWAMIVIPDLGALSRSMGRILLHQR